MNVIQRKEVVAIMSLRFVPTFPRRLKHHLTGSAALLWDGLRYRRKVAMSMNGTLEMMLLVRN